MKISDFTVFKTDMTLRDHFASLVLQTLINQDDDIDCDYISSVAYNLADAMMEKRNNHG